LKGFSASIEARLLELLEQEIDEFEQVRALTMKQTELLESDDIDAFDDSLDRRAALIEKINGLHQEQNVLMQSYISSGGAGENKKRSAVAKASDRLGEIIAECAEINENNLTVAKEKAGVYISQIGKLSLNRKGLEGYIQGVPNDPEHFDRKT